MIVNVKAIYTPSERQVLVFDYVDRWKFLSKDSFLDDLLKIAL